MFSLVLELFSLVFIFVQLCFRILFSLVLEFTGGLGCLLALAVVV